MGERFLRHDADRVIDEAVRQAQLVALDSPLQVGGVVAHPSDPIAYELRQIDDKTGIATVGCFDKKRREDVVRRYPLNELFDPNIAGDIALGMVESKVRRVIDAAPNN